MSVRPEWASCEGIRTLYGWFGNKQFQIRDIDDDRLLMLECLTGSHRSVDGRRVSLGLALREKDGQECFVSSNQTIRLVVVVATTPNAGGIYQVVPGSNKG